MLVIGDWEAAEGLVNVRLTGRAARHDAGGRFPGIRAACCDHEGADLAERGACCLTRSGSHKARIFVRASILTPVHFVLEWFRGN